MGAILGTLLGLFGPVSYFGKKLEIMILVYCGEERMYYMQKASSTVPVHGTCSAKVHPSSYIHSVYLYANVPGRAAPLTLAR